MFFVHLPVLHALRFKKRDIIIFLVVYLSAILIYRCSSNKHHFDLYIGNLPFLSTGSG